MSQLQITTEQRDILAEIGHTQLLLESHEAAAHYCRQQMGKLRDRLMALEQPAAIAEQAQTEPAKPST